MSIALASPAARSALIALAVLVLAGIFVILRPVAAPPQDRSFDVAVSDDGMSPREVRANEGDLVRLRITSDREIAFHLHGYDLELELRPGATETLEFRADRTGRFEIEDESTEEEIGELIVEPR